MLFKPNPKRRIEIIEFIIKYLKENKRCPTVREIMRGVNLKSPSTVWYHLEYMGWTGIEGLWSRNKKELKNKYICPCCQRAFKGLDNLGKKVGN